MSALAARTRVRVRLPWRTGLAEALEPTLRAFESLGGGPAPEMELFDPVATAAVERVSCASPAAQAREVARRCAKLLAAGAAPDSIAVAARSLGGGVAEELAAALGRAGIPWRERRGRPALTAAAVRQALMLHRVIEENFPREAMIELLPAWVARRLRQAHVRDDASDGGYAGRLAALAGKTARAIVNLDAIHSYHYIPDVAAGLMTLGCAESDAYGRPWMLPCAPAGTMRELAARFSASLGREIKLAGVPRWAVKAIGLVVPLMREVAEMFYQWDEPFVIDDRRFRERLRQGPTDVDVVAAATVATRASM